MAHESHEEDKEEPIGRNTTYETMTIGTGNQTIKLRDTDNIVGITLVSGTQDLHYGRISGTSIFGSLREELNITMHGLDGEFYQSVGTTFKVTDEGVTIVQFNPGYSIKGGQGKSGVQLGSMVVIRSIPSYAETYETSDEPEFHKRWHKDKEDKEDKDQSDENNDYWLDKYRGG